MMSKRKPKSFKHFSTSSLQSLTISKACLVRRNEMYNHFGYRTPIPNLYMAGSAGHPGGAISGGAGYITAGIIARDLGAELWWKPADALSALGKISRAA
jgi:hypothetical protein